MSRKRRGIGKKIWPEKVENSYLLIRVHIYSVLLDAGASAPAATDAPRLALPLAALHATKIGVVTALAHAAAHLGPVLLGLLRLLPVLGAPCRLEVTNGNHLQAPVKNDPTLLSQNQQQKTLS